MDYRTTSTVCRVCLRADRRTNKKSTSVFDNYKGCVISDQICSIADVTIRDGDGLPNKICSKCLVALDIAYNFKITCESSHNLLNASVNEEKPGELNYSAEPELTNIKDEPEVYDNVAEDSQDNYYYSDEVDFSDIDIKLEEKQQTQENNKSHKPTEQDLTSIEKTEFIKNEDDKKLILNLDDSEFQEENKKIEIVVKKAVENSLRTKDQSEDGVEERKSKAIDLKLQCHDCGEFFKSKCKLRVHWKKVHLLEKLVCSTCKLAFKAVKTYVNHKKKNSCNVDTSHIIIKGVGKSRIFECKLCPHVTKYASAMKSHLKTHTGERSYVCNLCPKAFSHSQSLIGHQETAHKIYKVVMTCPYCGKIVKGRDRVYSHLKQHKPKKYQCDICKAVLKSRDSMVLHLKLHDNAKPYVCKICSATFKLMIYLNQHVKSVHEKFRRYVCDICGYKTNNKKAKDIHRSRHNGTNCLCSVCGSFYADPEKLAEHQKIHFGVRNFKCPHCEKKFLTSKAVGKHVRGIHKKSYITVKEINPIVKKESLLRH